MALDMRTILVVTVLLDLIITWNIWHMHYEYRARYRGTLDWFLCFLLNIAGNLLLASRGFLPDVLSMVAAHVLMTMSIFFLAKGAALITGQTPPRGTVLVPAVLSCVYQIFVSLIFPSLLLRAFGSSILTLAGSALTVWYLRKGERGEFRSAFWIMAVMCFSLIVRLSVIIATRYEGNWLTNVPVDTFFMLVFLFVYLGLGFSYMQVIDGLVMRDLGKSDEAHKLLFREMRHRTKNNLALISSLVSLQSETVSDAGAKAAFGVLQSRLRTISSVYRLLSSGQMDQKADVKEYLTSVLSGIRDGQLADRGISFVTELESEQVDSAILVPLGLIVNELVTNAVKYAFKGTARPTIKVRFSLGGGRYSLAVEDNGLGLPAGARDTGGMGLSLADSLAAQLKGKLSFSEGSEGGTMVSLSFPVSSQR